MNRIIYLLLLLLLASMAYAQNDNPWNEKADWAYELSGIYNFSFPVLDDVKDEMDFYRSVYNNDQTYSITEDEEFGCFSMLDFKLGLRYKRVVAGINFSNTFDQESIINARYTSYYDEDMQGEESVSMSVNCKEYLLYLGYLHPLTSRIDVLGLASMGLGSADAQIKVYSNYESDGTPSVTRVDHNLKSDYIPMRLEGHIRYNLTRFIDLDISAGYKISKPSDMTGDRSTKYNGQETTPEFDVHAVHHVNNGASEEELLFDYSGVFYGIGITLKNPLEKKDK